MNPDRSGLDPAFFLACLIAIVVIGGFSLLGAFAAEHIAGSPHRCQEDEDCWNPARMGNGVGFVCIVDSVGNGKAEIVAYHDPNQHEFAGAAWLVPDPGLHPGQRTPCPKQNR